MEQPGTGKMDKRIWIRDSIFGKIHEARFRWFILSSFGDNSHHDKWFSNEVDRLSKEMGKLATVDSPEERQPVNPPNQSQQLKQSAETANQDDVGESVLKDWLRDFINTGALESLLLDIYACELMPHWFDDERRQILREAEFETLLGVVFLYRDFVMLRRVRLEELRSAINTVPELLRSIFKTGSWVLIPKMRRFVRRMRPEQELAGFRGKFYQFKRDMEKTLSDSEGKPTASEGKLTASEGKLTAV